MYRLVWCKLDVLVTASERRLNFVFVLVQVVARCLVETEMFMAAGGPSDIIG